MRKRLALAIVYMLVVILLSSTALMYYEGMNVFNAVYLSIATITTVGYGDLIPHTQEGKVVVMLLMIGGIGFALYFASTFVGTIIEGHLADEFGRRKMLKKIHNLKDHIIICGAGRVGQQVIQRLKQESTQFIVIERDHEVVDRLRADNVLTIVGDATNDEVLMEVGIERAKGLITALPEDTQNVYVTLTSRGLNSNLYIVARMDRMESESKLLRAGADKVISPAILGGRRMAISILKPGTCDYVDTLIHDKDWEMQIEEIRVSESSILVNKTIRASAIKETTGAVILAIMREKSFISNPSPEEIIMAGDFLITIGSNIQTTKLEQLALDK